MKIVADLEKCIGAGQCVHNSPRFFTQDEDTGLVVVPGGEIPADALEEVETALYSCPTRALSLKG